MAIRIKMGGSSYLMANRAVTDYSLGFIYASCFGYTTEIKNFAKELNRKQCKIEVNGYEYQLQKNCYETLVSSVPDSDYSHLIVYRKDREFENEGGTEDIEAFLFIEKEAVALPGCRDMERMGEYPQEFLDGVYDKLEKLSPVMVLREWMPGLVGRLIRGGMLHSGSVDEASSSATKMSTYVMQIPVPQLRNIISDALRRGEISINGSNAASETMSAIDGIDAYLETFNDVLTSNIKESFTARFTPGEDEESEALENLCDWQSYMGQLTPYPAQRAVVQATSNALDEKKCAFIIAEMGSGQENQAC